MILVAVWPGWSTCLIASCARRRPQTVSIASVVARPISGSLFMKSVLSTSKRTSISVLPASGPRKMMRPKPSR